jgi:hypothetical protein
MNAVDEYTYTQLETGTRLGEVKVKGEVVPVL